MAQLYTGVDMGYAADHDDMEQVAQGEDAGESSFSEFVEDTVGRDFGELSNSERSNLMWQWQQERKRRHSA